MWMMELTTKTMTADSKMGSHSKYRSVMTASYFLRTAPKCVIDRFLRDFEFRHRGVAHVADIFDTGGAGVERIHYHAARPIEEADSRAEFGRFVLAVCDEVEHGGLLLGFGAQEIRRIAPLDRMIEPRDAARVDREKLRVLARKQIDKLAGSRSDGARRNVVGRQDVVGELLQRFVLVLVQTLRFVCAGGRFLLRSDSVNVLGRFQSQRA